MVTSGIEERDVSHRRPPDHRRARQRKGKDKLTVNAQVSLEGDGGIVARLEAAGNSVARLAGGGVLLRGEGGGEAERPISFGSRAVGDEVRQVPVVLGLEGVEIHGRRRRHVGRRNGRTRGGRGDGGEEGQSRGDGAGEHFRVLVG